MDTEIVVLYHIPISNVFLNFWSADKFLNTLGTQTVQFLCNTAVQY
jgi:hypothetical protein